MKPSGYATAKYHKYDNILHLTVGGDSQHYGDRTPAVFLHPKRGILVSSAVNGESAYGFWCRQHQPKAGIWTEYAVSQVKKEGDKYIYSISINGEEVHRTVNTRPEVFKDVGVFASNPWDGNPSSLYSIRNLKIDSEITGIT